MLVAHSVGVDRPWVLAHSSDEFAGQGLETLCERRERREPLAYILGWREFFGRRFIVTPDVLIPRQETETLVDIAKEMPFVERVLDVGTGSGCLAVTLALEKPEWTVEALDVSEAALRVAQQNARALGAKVVFHRSDFFGDLTTEPFDLIVSNPPYIEMGADLQPEVRDFEPHQALFADDKGCAAYICLAEGAPAHLRLGGRLIVELGDGMAVRVAEVFESRGWHCELVANDLSGTERAMVLAMVEV